jgi:hypothetical protein
MDTVTHFSRDMRLKLVYHLMFSASESRLGVLQGGLEAGACRSCALFRPAHPLHVIPFTSPLAARQRSRGSSVHPTRPDMVEQGPRKYECPVAA